MNYQTHYDKLILRAKNRILDGYVEKHHIVPKCLGGSDDIDNLVALTAREHFIAHGLLAKIYNGTNNGYKLAAAFRFMSVDSHSGNRKSNRDYDWMRKLYAKNHPCKSPEVVEKIRNSTLSNVMKYREEKRVFYESFIGPPVPPKMDRRRQARSDKSKKSTSATMKEHLSNLTIDEKKLRVSAALNCDQVARANAIRLGKSSTIKMTNNDGTDIIFSTCDDVKSISGISYDMIKYWIKKGVADKHGRHFEYVRKYDNGNSYNNS
jgi:hypothetical protein